MKVFNKLLIASSMVVTLGATIACNNKGNDNSGGVPYTYFALAPMYRGDEYTVGFKYKGSDDIKVYWGIESTTPSKETSHTFICTHSFLPIVRIEGNVSSIWFADEKGELIEKDNDRITTILFSNTITSIPKMACYSLINLRNVFIPKSVKQVGANAFIAPMFDYAICAASSRPSGWDKDWASTAFVSEFVIWGVNYYITDDNIGYATYAFDQTKEAYYCGYLFPPNEEIKELTIPETTNINGTEYNVTTLLSVGAACSTIEKITINNNIKNIASEAIADCSNLTSVIFNGNFENLFLDEAIFARCTSLEEIVLPQNLTRVPRYLFMDCDNLGVVTIPNSVRWLDDESFCDCSVKAELLQIDVTSYKDADEIARCGISPFDLSLARIVIILYDDSNVSEDDFIKKNWPEGGYQDYGPYIHWQPFVDINE